MSLHWVSSSARDSSISTKLCCKFFASDFICRKSSNKEAKVSKIFDRILLSESIIWNNEVDSRSSSLTTAMAVRLLKSFRVTKCFSRMRSSDWLYSSRNSPYFFSCSCAEKTVEEKVIHFYGKFLGKLS